MDELVDATALTPASRLRARRKELRMTLKDVAEKSGLSFSFIAQIERGRAMPSLTSLITLARVLDVPISYFVDQPMAQTPETRHAQRVPYSVGPSSVVYERLSTTFPGSQLNCALIHEPPGYRTEPMTHEGEEFIYMIEGSLTVELEGKAYVLDPGDSLHFLSARVHTTWNHTDRTSVMLHTCTLDYFGDNAG